MALRGTFLSWSDDPEGFAALMEKSGTPVSLGVFVTESDDIPRSVAGHLGAKVYVVEIEVATLSTYP